MAHLLSCLVSNSLNIGEPNESPIQWSQVAKLPSFRDNVGHPRLPSLKVSLGLPFVPSF